MANQTRINQYDMYKTKHDLDADYPKSAKYEYAQLKAGEVFSSDWLENDFTAPSNGTIYQLANRNVFIKYVFVNTEEPAHISMSKCEKIYKELQVSHMNECEIKKKDGSVALTANLWTSSAREIEAELYRMNNIERKITNDELVYIFGLVCRSALSRCDGEFFRI